MGYGFQKSQGKGEYKKVKLGKSLVIASLCLCLCVIYPDFQSMESVSISPKAVLAQASDGGAQDSDTSDSGNDDTPSAEDIADFASEHDKDGDGEFDEPEEDEADEDADQDEPDEADQDDDADDSDESDDQDRDNQYDDDDDGEESKDEDDEDMAHSGKNRDDIDGDASPEFRLSGYDRYSMESDLRRLGAREELTPLIAREELMLLED